ncbi:hypothetical protein ACH5RR_018346 [Cinchona calisaya]|uniref:GBF-interacting protein 1 N-terminal domain-containing protein n=1 Tax=Cinchona calisaya TaxID=153742 RepID=A0ABD2ZL72_9GENT
MGSGGGRKTTTNNNNNNNGGVGVGGLQSIPSGSRKIVQSLKEIVNCPEPEIYAMLKECNMDPNEAVNRLLSQDPFHEVKGKKEKKKESKDTSESRPQGKSSTSNRGRSSADRYASRGGSTQYSSAESGSLLGRPTQKKENGSNAYASAVSSASGMAGNNTSRRPPSYSDAAATEVKGSIISMLDSVSSASQLSGYQPVWVGAPGQVSMADIVKMGKPHSKASSTPSTSYNVNHQHIHGPSFTAHQNLWFSGDHASKVSEEHLDPGVSSAQHVSIDDEWPSIEQPVPTSVPSVSQPPVDPELHPDSSNLPCDLVDRHSGADEVQAVEDSSIEEHDANHVGPATVSSRKLHEDNSGSVSLFQNDLYRNRESYQPQNHSCDCQGVENVSVSVSSVTANLQQLSMQKGDRASTLDSDGPSVVIPDHLQVQSADCSHLSFGSFRSGISTSFSGSLASMPVKTNLEVAPMDADGSSIGHSETRNSEYYGDESLRNASDGNLFHRPGASTGSYDSSSASQPEPVKVENLEVERGNQYAFPSSTPGYSFENPQQLNIGFSESQTSTQMQDLSPYANGMLSYTNSLANTLLAANVPPGRESDLPYPFPATQSMGAKYGNSISSLGGPSISMAEALKTLGFSSTQHTPQTMAGTTVATGPALPQHLAAHAYSQPTLPLGPFTNMISYPFLPQSYAYMPSAFQQAFPGNSTYHQSLATLLPQYKNSVSVSSLSQPAAVASGYGAFGSSTTVPGNFPMNPPAAPSGTNLGYDDVLSAQYKDSNHLLSLQQSDSSGMWLHGPGSRTMSAVPASTYYSFQGPNQPPAGFRQGQQPSQNYGALGYPNFYHSQNGMSLDHQQQNPRDGSFSGSQGQPKQSQQTWQNNY